MSSQPEFIHTRAIEQHTTPPDKRIAKDDGVPSEKLNKKSLEDIVFTNTSPGTFSSRVSTDTGEFTYVAYTTSRVSSPENL